MNRFAFGDNWCRYLDLVNEERIEAACESLRRAFGSTDLRGKRFLDVGSGSGLFSLAAQRLGARVHSFDSDPASVACTREMKRRYAPADVSWTVADGSILDRDLVADLGRWDVVYAWGVLHHTGDMAQALENVAELVADQGTLYLAIYNDQGRRSARWCKVKRMYNRLHRGFRWPVLLAAGARLWGPTMVRDLLAGRPGRSWREYPKNRSRGMSPWHDVIDWVGGMPFEVARPEAIFRFYHARGFRLEGLVTCGGGHGCNEFVFGKR